MSGPEVAEEVGLPPVRGLEAASREQFVGGGAVSAEIAGLDRLDQVGDLGCSGRTECQRPQRGAGGLEHPAGLLGRADDLDVTHDPDEGVPAFRGVHHVSQPGKHHDLLDRVAGRRQLPQCLDALREVLELGEAYAEAAAPDPHAGGGPLGEGVADRDLVAQRRNDGSQVGGGARCGAPFVHVWSSSAASSWTRAGRHRRIRPPRVRYSRSRSAWPSSRFAALGRAYQKIAAKLPEDPVLRQAVAEVTLSGMVVALGDNHARRTRLPQQRSLLGLQFSAFHAGGIDPAGTAPIFVTAVAPGSGAQSAGIKPGDEVVAVNGVPLIVNGIVSEGVIAWLSTASAGQPAQLTLRRPVTVWGSKLGLPR